MYPLEEQEASIHQQYHFAPSLVQLLPHQGANVLQHHEEA
jgi:hypothetical protein